ncbi:MAG: hypothetical protein NQ127_02080 [Candidatus Cardinium sp.]|nr:hypothetical protein [Candidatus Cardinium sp.]
MSKHRCRKPIKAHSVAPAIENAGVDMKITYPAYGQLSISNELKQ